MKFSEITEGSVVEVTEIAASKAIDQTNDNWYGNLELGQDEIYEWLQEGVTLEVRSINEKVRTNKVTITMVATDLDGFKSIVAGTYPSWFDDNNHMDFDADGHHTNYSSKYFNAEIHQE